MNRTKLRPWDAVIFDYGGVLSFPPFHRELLELGQHSGLDGPSFFRLYSNTRDYYGRSPADYKQHWLQVADALGLQISVASVEKLVVLESDLWTRPNAEVLELAREIRGADVRTAILSNMTFHLLGKLRERLEWLREFEVQIWSCEEGCSKPDARIYRACLTALGCQAGRALFFDDRPRNVEAARNAGIEAYVFESAQQARTIVLRGLNPQEIA